MEHTNNGGASSEEAEAWVLVWIGNQGGLHYRNVRVYDWGRNQFGIDGQDTSAGARGDQSEAGRIGHDNCERGEEGVEVLANYMRCTVASTSIHLQYSVILVPYAFRVCLSSTSYKLIFVSHAMREKQPRKAMI